jgi:hypothetical protein
VLFLLENPGRRATSAHGSGFISADNADDTAANFFHIRDQASLPRDLLVAWNVVPWYQPDGERTANAMRHDVVGALPWLIRLTGLLTELRLVVTMGGIVPGPVLPAPGRDSRIAAVSGDDRAATVRFPVRK